MKEDEQDERERLKNKLEELEDRLKYIEKNREKIIYEREKDLKEKVNQLPDREPSNPDNQTMKQKYENELIPEIENNPSQFIERKKSKIEDSIKNVKERLDD